jgi:hypothetical protein
VTKYVPLLMIHQCDEKRPVCSSCSRHAVPCVYNKSSSAPSKATGTSVLRNSSPTPAKKPKLLPYYATSSGPPAPEAVKDSTMSVGSLLSSDAAESDVFDIPESKSRRRLELRLLENYMSNACPSFPACHGLQVKHAWSVEVPRMAMECDNLLSGIFSISALQLVRADCENQELIAARHNYLGLSLREHRKAVAQLCSRSADSACFASTLFLLDVFTSLQDRVLEPYSPLITWLNMARGAGAIFKTSLDSIRNYSTARITKVVNAHPRLDNGDVLFTESNRRNLLGLLAQDVALGQEVWDNETKEAYEKTLSSIGSAQIGLKSHEHQLVACRRMMAFANLVPERFLAFVEEQRPRALAILAHFFALSAELESLWWIRDTAQREIGAIQ